MLYKLQEILFPECNVYFNARFYKTGPSGEIRPRSFQVRNYQRWRSTENFLGFLVSWITLTEVLKPPGIEMPILADDLVAYAIECNADYAVVRHERQQDASND